MSAILQTHDSLFLWTLLLNADFSLISRNSFLVVVVIVL